jgi:hypothetical protein
VKCPAGCAKAPGNVYGNVLFKDDSVICKAAIHNGIIKDINGGHVTIAFDEGRSNYLSTEKNEVLTKSFSSKTPWQRSFVTNRFRRLCP